jgi:hypothetical protein
VSATAIEGKVERWHLPLRIRVLLVNYFLLGDLAVQIEAFVVHRRSGAEPTMAASWFRCNS